MKKVLSLVLVAMLVLSLAPTVLAADYAGYGFSAAGVEYGDAEVTLTAITPYANTLKMELWNAGKAVTNKDAIDAKLGITRRNKTASVVTGVALKTDAKKPTETAIVEVTFNGDFDGTKGVDYKFDLFVTVNKQRDNDSMVTFDGNYAHDTVEVDDTYDYAYLGSNFPVLASKAYIKKLEVEVEGGVTLITKTFKDKNYYAKASSGITGDYDAEVTAYPDIINVYTLKQNSWGSDTKVKLAGEPAGKPVYGKDADGNLELLGTTDGGDLPLAALYFVADKELDIAIDEPEEEPTVAEEPTYDVGGETGGDEVPANINDNPGTGC
jgi:hypothetical protein